MKINLPIDSYIPQIISETLSSVPLILTATPGSGKTTRFPAELRNHLAEKNKLHTQKIIVIVPKRISAVAAADRIADENNLTLGEEVGYQVRFENKTSNQTQLIFMTEGVFLKKIQNSNYWNEIHTLILDEFHERSSAIDLILGLSYDKKISQNLEFNLVVMSATLNVTLLQNYFLESKLIEVKGKAHPLQVFYSEKSQRLQCDDQFYSQLKDTVVKAFKTSQKDILVFLPGKYEIIKFKKTLESFFVQNPIECLHGGISLSEQRRITLPHATQGLRRIILSTNVAESSLTISGVDCVVDSGLEKKLFREEKLKFTGLDLTRVSLFSATQRAGRAAREQQGYCFKMWHETDERSMSEQIEPEILSSTLIDEIILLKKLNFNNILQFLWLNSPKEITINKALRQLEKWGLLTDSDKLNTISNWPLKTENALIHYELTQQNYAKESAQLLTALESDQLELFLQGFHPQPTHDEIDHILDYKITHPQTQKMFEQIVHLTPAQNKKPLNNQIDNSKKENNFKFSLIQVFTKYFSERIAQRKSMSTATSLNGRGLTLPSNSSLEKSDFFIILAARENHTASTIVQLGLGFDKKIAYELFESQAQKIKNIEYDFSQNKFYAFEKLQFENITLKDFGKSELSKKEIDTHWISFLKDQPDAFLSIHPVYEKLKTKISFINKKTEIFKTTLDISELQSKLIEMITQFYTDFQDFLHCDLLYLTYQSLSDEHADILQNLPDTLQTPRGKSITIDYADDKAPMISLKLQEAFGWADTPQIFHNKILVTLQLLAPNMRPTQITSQLALFWKTSYNDVKKELKARYPKHDWPDDPSI